MELDNKTREGGLEVNKLEFMALHGQCVTVMNTYFTEVQKTSVMLGKCTPTPLSFGQRFALLRQEIIEKDAHLRYQDVKRPLHSAARLGFIKY